MLSLRSLARSVPRNASRLSSVASVAPRRLVPLRPAFQKASPLQLRAAFSTSRPRYEANEELAAKLNSEIQLEQDQQEQSYRESIQEFLDSTEYQLEDVPGQEEVLLTRTYGDEKIKITFSIADFNSQDTEMDEEDPALYDEEDGAADLPSETQSGGANTKGSINQGRTPGGNIRVAPEDSVAPADREELRDDDVPQEPSFPARVQVQVSREGKGALTIECIAQDGEITIENVYHFPSVEMAEAKTYDNDFSRRSVYAGPPFGQLDEDLQVLLERYLEERGINTSMALFIPDYIDAKEQKEYIRWLDNMKTFVE